MEQVGIEPTNREVTLILLLCLVEMVGIEPTISCVSDKCLNHSASLPFIILYEWQDSNLQRLRPKRRTPPIELHPYFAMKTGFEPATTC